MNYSNSKFRIYWSEFSVIESDKGNRRVKIFFSESVFLLLELSKEALSVHIFNNFNIQKLKIKISLREEGKSEL